MKCYCNQKLEEIFKTHSRSLYGCVNVNCKYYQHEFMYFENKVLIGFNIGYYQNCGFGFVSSSFDMGEVYDNDLIVSKDFLNRLLVKTSLEEVKEIYESYYIFY